MTKTTAAGIFGGTHGLYCFDLAFTPLNVTASESIGPTSTPTGLLQTPPIVGVAVVGTTALAGTGCPSGTDAVVVAGFTFSGSPLVTFPATFYAVFH